MLCFYFERKNAIFSLSEKISQKQQPGTLRVTCVVRSKTKETKVNKSTCAGDHGQNGEND